MLFPLVLPLAKVKIFIFRPKTMDYNPWFDFRNPKKVLIRIPLERASQEEQNGANFSFVAPSSEEFRVCIPAPLSAYGKGRRPFKLYRI